MKIGHTLGLAAATMVLTLAGWLGGCSSDGGAACATPGAQTGATSTAVSCSDYCKNMTNCCTGANAQYASNDACLAMCGKMTPGASGDTAGNTVACRQYHANAAVSAPDTHCKHAGPSGAKTCGPNPCEAFCQLNLAVCGSGASAPYSDRNACLTACAALPFTSAGEATDTSKNTLNCRIYHLQAAYSGAAAAATHCAHTAATSPVCNQ